MPTVSALWARQTPPPTVEVVTKLPGRARGRHRHTGWREAAGRRRGEWLSVTGRQRRAWAPAPAPAHQEPTDEPPVNVSTPNDSARNTPPIQEECPIPGVLQQPLVLQRAWSCRWRRQCDPVQGVWPGSCGISRPELVGRIRLDRVMRFGVLARGVPPRPPPRRASAQARVAVPLRQTRDLARSGGHHGPPETDPPLGLAGARR